MEYVMKKQVALSFKETIGKAREGLGKEGFGVLTVVVAAGQHIEPVSGFGANLLKGGEGK